MQVRPFSCLGPTLGTGSSFESAGIFFLVTTLLWRTLQVWIREINRAVSFARESNLYPISRVVYPVVRLCEDSLQLPRPNPAVQQQARPLRVTAACIHIYGFKQERSLLSLRQLTASLELCRKEGIMVCQLIRSTSNWKKCTTQLSGYIWLKDKLAYLMQRIFCPHISQLSQLISGNIPHPERFNQMIYIDPGRRRITAAYYIKFMRRIPAANCLVVDRQFRLQYAQQRASLQLIEHRVVATKSLLSWPLRPGA